MRVSSFNVAFGASLPDFVKITSRQLVLPRLRSHRTLGFQLTSKSENGRSTRDNESLSDEKSCDCPKAQLTFSEPFKRYEEREEGSAFDLSHRIAG